MLTRKNRRRLTTLSLFLLPVIGVKSVGFLMNDAGPDSASADDYWYEDDFDGDETDGGDRVVTPDEWKAREYVLASKELAFKSAPLYDRVWSSRDDQQPEPNHAPPVATDNPQRQGGNPPKLATPRFTINAILYAASGHVAILDGERFGVGDRVHGSFWKVMQIKTRTVRLMHIRDGVTIDLHLGLP